MDFNRTWTQFAVSAEVDEFGVGRIAEAHNKLRGESARLLDQLREAEREVERLKDVLRGRDNCLKIEMTYNDLHVSRAFTRESLKNSGLTPAIIGDAAAEMFQDLQFESEQRTNTRQ